VYKPGQSGNLKGRPPKGAPRRFDSTRTDGWYSMLTGLGTPARDKRTSTGFCADVVPYEQALEYWRGDDLAARLVETVPNEMTREGWRFCVPDDAEGNTEDYGVELSERVAEKWEALGVIGAVHQALCFKYAFGGGAILMGADDGQPLDQKLDLAKIKSFDWLTVFEPRELIAIGYYSDPRAPMFGKPALYQLTPVMSGAPAPGQPTTTPTIRVHESRLIIFNGTKVSNLRQRGTWGDWGDSIFTRVSPVLRDFNLAWGSAGILVSSFAPAVFKIEDLHKIMSENNKELFQARMAAVALSQATAGVTLIDKNEEYKREQTPVTGLADLLDRFSRRFAAAADIPFQVLFGESPGGINAGGASGDQIRMWYDRIRSKQVRDLMPGLKRLTLVLLPTLGGAPENWSIEFCSLWQPTEAEDAETRKKQMEIDTGYFGIGSLTSEEIRRARFSGDQFSYATRVITTEPDEPTEKEIEEYKSGATPAVDPAAPAGEDVQKTAMNGAQIESLILTVEKVLSGSISRESGIAILMTAFQLTEADAAALLGPATFEPTTPPAAPPPFGGGGF
jgi:phage-related protein (TIGR01555 family)